MHILHVHRLIWVLGQAFCAAEQKRSGIVYEWSIACFIDCMQKYFRYLRMVMTETPPSRGSPLLLGAALGYAHCESSTDKCAVIDNVGVKVLCGAAWSVLAMRSCIRLSSIFLFFPAFGFLK